MTAQQAILIYQKSSSKLTAAINTLLIQSGERVVITLTDKYQEILTGIEMRKNNDHVEIRGTTDSLTVNCHGQQATISLN